ncbi:methyltransferase domain-containing protein [Candidatus Woesearchaeota archaeon]|nr:methyltransferase domain-containing protein [Candidatus Woesearchaeota archaeon]
MSTKDYYDEIAPGYDELHKGEQLAKLILMLDTLNVRKDDRVLDVGCGTAFSFELLHPLGCKYQGVEPSIGLIAESKYGAKITNCNAESLPFPNNLFTVVISVTALQNFKDPKKGLEEMKRVCSDRLAISFLKDSPKREKLSELISSLFTVDGEMEQDKDIIYFCSV